MIVKIEQNHKKQRTVTTSSNIDPVIWAQELSTDLAKLFHPRASVIK